MGLTYFFVWVVLGMVQGWAGVIHWRLYRRVKQEQQLSSSAASKGKSAGDDVHLSGRFGSAGNDSLSSMVSLGGSTARVNYGKGGNLGPHQSV